MDSENVLQFLSRPQEPYNYPAMEAGIADYTWTIEEMVGMVSA
jgi:hypothetical protein